MWSKKLLEQECKALTLLGQLSRSLESSDSNASILRLDFLQDVAPSNGFMLISSDSVPHTALTSIRLLNVGLTEASSEAVPSSSLIMLSLELI